MSERPSRSYLIIAAAIVIAGALISASLFVAIGQPTKTVTTISTQISTVTTTPSQNFSLSKEVYSSKNLLPPISNTSFPWETRLVEFTANDSGYLLVSARYGDFYAYLTIFSASSGQNGTYNIPDFTAFKIPLLPGDTTVYLTLRIYATITIPESFGLNMTYYY